MTQNSHTQSENWNLQHEDRNEISENRAREVQFWIEADNQFNMIIKRWKQSKKESCFDDTDVQNQSRSTKTSEKTTLSCEIDISNSWISRLSIK